MFPFRGALIGSPRESERVLRGIADHSRNVYRKAWQLVLSTTLKMWELSSQYRLRIQFQTPQKARQSQLEDMRHWGSSPHPDGDKPSWILNILLSLAK